MEPWPETKALLRRSPTQTGSRIAKRRERRDTRPQEIVAAAFEEFAAKGYAGDKARGRRRSRAGQQGPALSLLQDQGRAVQGGDAERHHPHFDVIRKQMETTDMSSEDFLKGPFLAFIQELVLLASRAFIARLLIAEGHKHPELTDFYYEHVMSRGIETLTA